MEGDKNMQPQEQEELSFGAYSCLLATPTQSTYNSTSLPSNLHYWKHNPNSNTILNNGSNYNPYVGESTQNSKETRHPCDTQNYGPSNAQCLLLERVNDEASIFQTWSHHEMNVQRPSSNAQDDRKHNQSHDDNLWTNGNFSFGTVYPQEASSFRDLMAPTRSYISTNELTSSLVSSSLSLNLEAFDILSSTNYDGTSASDSSTSQANLGYFKELNVASSSSHEGYMIQGLRDRNSPSNNSIKRHACHRNEAPPVTKRPNGFPKHKEGVGEAKKSRVVAGSRSSCPPLKVTKEKVGDRIAALQKLVAPFGKTDTASVLTEAIGYIQFLHHQLQTLSVPYMNSNRGGGRPFASTANGRREAKGDLRSRGLCLVPQSCASFIHGYDGSMWPPP